MWTSSRSENLSVIRTETNESVENQTDDDETDDSFLTTVESHQPGEQVVVTVIRERQRIDVEVTLGGENQ